MTPTICTKCGVERDYPAKRGDKIKDRKCRSCGAGPGSLVRAGNNPGKAGREAREKFGRDPKTGDTPLPAAEGS